MHVAQCTFFVSNTIDYKLHISIRVDRKFIYNLTIWKRWTITEKTLSIITIHVYVISHFTKNAIMQKSKTQMNWEIKSNDNVTLLNCQVHSSHRIPFEIKSVCTRLEPLMKKVSNLFSVKSNYYRHKCGCLNEWNN